MEEITPIKRSSQLAPLSREHHDGLLFVWKIRLGLKKNISIDKLRKYTLWYWKEHIKSHFFQEEKILLPYVAADLPMVVRLKKEHADIRELILNLDQEGERRNFSLLCDLVDDHIRFEEGQFFGFIEETLSKDQLDTVFVQLNEYPVCQDQWKDPFWEE